MVRSTRLIVTNATDERMVKQTETNKQAQNTIYEQAQVHTKAIADLPLDISTLINTYQQVFRGEASCWSLLKLY